MATNKKTPIDVFNLSIQDAEWLIQTASFLQNDRLRKLRVERRRDLASIFHYSYLEQSQLDAIDNEHAFILLKPGSALLKSHVDDLTPLYRQSIIIAAAAIETYLTDRVAAEVVPVIRDSDSIPKVLAELRITIEEWKKIDGYKSKRVGLRETIHHKIAEWMSPDPSKVGPAVKMIIQVSEGKSWADIVDKRRQISFTNASISHVTKADIDEIKSGFDGKLPKTMTEFQLKHLAILRNRIAHSNDFSRGRRRGIDLELARKQVEFAKDFVRSIELSA